MKQLFTIFFLTFTVGLFAQTLKTFNGPFDAGYLQGGTAFYTYYENPETHEYIKQGSYKYTFIGTGDHKGYTETISGSYEKGLKNGKWTYAITMADFGADNPFFTGTVSLIANYKNGYAHGNWKEVKSYKSRKKSYSYGTFEWKSFEPLKTMTINMNFKEGYLVGLFNINDEFSNYMANGSFDDNSFCTGTWTINDRGWNRNFEAIFKDNLLFEFISRENSGEVRQVDKYHDNYSNLLKAKTMLTKERLELGIIIDTIIDNTVVRGNTASNISEYFPKLFDKNYFLFDDIGGDLTFKDGIKGGFSIHVYSQEFKPLNDIKVYRDAELAYNINDLLTAWELYNKALGIIDMYKYQLKPSEKNIISEKITLIKPQIQSLIDTYGPNRNYFSEYISTQKDSLSQDIKYFSHQMALSRIYQQFDNPSMSGARPYPYFVTDDNGVRKEIFACGCENDIIEKPWLAESWKKIEPCFRKNKDVYNFIHFAITEQYFNYLALLKTEENKVNETFTEIFLNGKRYSFYRYNQDTFLNTLTNEKKPYLLAKSFIGLDKIIKQKKFQIETLNTEKPKKVLFIKYQIVFDNFLLNYKDYKNMQASSEILNIMVSFLDKVISLYSQDTKEIEKRLKKETETADQIISILLSS